MADIDVKKKIGSRCGSGVFSPRIREVRDRLGLDQKAFAEHLGITQSVVSEWESNRYDPSSMALVAIGRLAPSDQNWWYEKAGPQYAERLKSSPLGRSSVADVSSQDERVTWVPLMRDAVAAGAARSISEYEVERQIPFILDYIQNGAKLRALKVRGDSMAPVIHEGDIVVVDASQQNPKKLVGKMVAARVGDGVTIKWLRKDQDDFLLVPQHVSLAIPVQILRPDADWSIVGVVMKWIGYPASGK